MKLCPHKTIDGLQSASLANHLLLWGFTNFNFKLKVSAFYLEKQKSFITKKKFFLAVPPRFIPKMALAGSIFQKVLVIPILSIQRYLHICIFKKGKILWVQNWIFFLLEVNKDPSFVTALYFKIGDLLELLNYI